MPKRKWRIGEVLCTCRAYPFAHRQMGGACDGGAFVGAYFTAHVADECRDCGLFDADGATCQALEGIEELQHCPALQEHIQFNEIQLYGINRPARGYRTRAEKAKAKRSGRR
jgi:hypothetical protein